ncbi:uncharacterized protein DUF4255 [Pseudoduganella flava]|uniref:DUF4255 domain-containing protein n=1 Tax=Pseudoduganella flava TaxID=871742 RepID=A0A562Q1N6_9BURK|nr:DUF4255 domain-containing protein [Pseudoduganella flava]QGZ38232.1 DUF4255 domain-containing protein [Pseudoduganella flava]TWI50236.1 uncharacterized protein DUF4255 [Pseudoduganella flava]
MSNTLAIAATTATLRKVLLQRIGDLDATLKSDLTVTTQPLDLVHQARKDTTPPQLNIFLYHTALNAGWRNTDLPDRSRPGERGIPPLALNLYYMITAYATNNNDDKDGDESSHRVLCAAMSVLHDYPVLSRADIEAALDGNDLARQLERVRVTPQPLSVDEIYKLWTAYQAPYRISAAYEATVTLVDSRLTQQAAPPVLKRGKEDRGVFSMLGAAPRIDAVRIPGRQNAARLGEEVLLLGEHLSAAGAVVRFDGMRFPARIELPPVAGDTPGQLAVRLPASGPAPADPDAYVRWAPGFYALSLVQTVPDGPALASNQVGFALAPVITVAPLTVAAGPFTLTVTCAPQLRDGQQVRLIFGDRQAAPASFTQGADSSAPSTLTFDLDVADSGTYLVRLRVDGVDSVAVVYTGTPPVPGFDPQQQVTVQP